MAIRQYLRIIFLVLLGLVGIAAAGGFYLRHAFTQVGPSPEETTVIIPRGASLNATASLLAAENLITSADLFRIYTRLGGRSGDMRAGEFAIPAGASMSDILMIILEGDMVQRRLTVPEGLTSRQIEALVIGADGLEGDIEIAAGEGSLLPETYFYALWDERSELINRMRLRRDRVLFELWAEREADSPLISPEDAVILASIIEKETGLAVERSRIAAVYLNRLKQGMRLQSDPTVIYGITGGDPLGRPILRSELQASTPYNTYRINGLPPGPIANPGVESLRAVIHPAQIDDLYFVADGSGGHVFSETLEEHNRNVARWRRIEKERASGETN